MLRRFILIIGWLLPLMLAVLFAVKGRFYDEAVFSPPSLDASALPVPSAAGEWILENGMLLPADRMFEKINGKADYYLQYGAVELCSAEWVSNGESWDMYLYRFAEGQGARSAYNGERPADGQALEGIAGYTVPGQVAVNTGSYYLQLNAQAAQADTAAAETLALLIAEALGGEGVAKEQAAELDLVALAGEEMMGDAEGYLPESAFGFSSLNNVRTVDVSLAGNEAVWFTASGDPDTIAAFIEELRSYGGGELFNEAGCAGGSMFGTWELAGMVDGTVWGVHAASSREALMQHWQVLKERLHAATEVQ